MLGGLLLVLAAIGQLGRPETHRAIGRAFGEPPPAGAVREPIDSPPLIDSSEFDAVVDNAPFRDAETEAWFAVLRAVRDAEPAELAARSVGPVGYAALTSQPDAYRGRVVTVAGTVRRVEAVTPAENDLGIDRLWRVTLEPAGGQVWPITAYSLKEPRDAGEPYDASAAGVFFKKLSYRWAEGVGSTPVVVAPRLETTIEPPTTGVATTTPAEAEVDFTPPADQSLGRALLADLGVAPATLDVVRDKQRLLPAETEPFYAVLGALERTPATQLARLARVGLDDYVARRRVGAEGSLRSRQEFRAIQNEAERDRYSAVPLFGEGDRERGELIVLDAVVRRAVRVDATGSAAAASYGVDHYYELEAFPEDSQNLPVVFVVRDLPAGFPVGDAIRQPARLAGFFFKQWAYRTRQRSDADPAADRRQFAPLLVGRAPIPLATPDASAARPGLTIGLVASVALVGIVAALWRLAWHDRRHEATTLRRFREPPDASLDFRRLVEASDPVDSPGADA